jgi:ankyrin repeat protein
MKYIKLFEKRKIRPSMYELIAMSDAEALNLLVKEIRERDQPDLDLIHDILKYCTMNLNDQISDWTPLQLTIIYNHPIIITDVIKAGANIEGKNKDGLTPLHLAAKLPNRSILKMLIKAKADPNSKDIWLNTPLHYAGFSGCDECAKVLIKAGANVNAQDIGGDTPLHDAVRQENEDVAQMLVKSGARVDIQNNDGETPYDLLQSDSEYMERILDQAKR